MLIHGSKKGGGGGGTEAPDSLRSIQNAQLVDLISEGPIKGLVNGLKSVYLDGVPVQNEDGSNNFSGLNFAFLPGTQSQDGLPGFDAVEAERGVGVEVRASAPVVQTIVNTSVDHVRVTISVPQLTLLDTSNGNMNGSSFGFAIDVQSAGGGFVTLHTDTVTGKTTSTYKRGVRLKLPGNGPWDVRVRRTTPDSASTAIVNKFFWDSLTEIQSVTLRYTNSSVAGLHISSQQFSRVPTRAFDILGLMIRVPTNYDPIAGTYAGIWDGTFKTAWTNNPAWVYYDLATHPRYGLGRYIKDHHLDKWALYEIGRYCDERVSDGNGGTEPRFTCNLYLQTKVQARQALQDLAGLMRAIMYWGDGQIGVVQDAPADAVMLFTKANIVGNFSYETTSHRKRHSAWTVYYNDLTQMGRRMPVVHVAKDLVKTMGVVMETFSPIGCSSRGQALRLARWAEFSEAMGRMVSFRAGAEGAALRPGAVFKVADPAKAGKRLGGRIASSTTSTVTLDAAVELQAGETYQLEVMLVDAAAQLGYRTEKRTVTTGAGTTKVLQVSPPFTVAPGKAAIWVLQPTTIQPTWWRMVAKKEADGGKAFDVVAIEHDPDKFDAIEQGLKLAPKPTSGLSVVSPQLADFSITEVPYLGVDSTRLKALVSWTPPAAGLRFQVDWRLDSGLWVSLPQTSANSVEIEGLVVGTLDVRVTTVNSLGLTSQPREKSLALQGWGGLAPDVAGFSADVSASGVTLAWAACAAANYRETVISVGPTLVGAQEIFRGSATTTTWRPLTSGSYAFWAQHVNTSGKASAAVATSGADWVERGTLAVRINADSFSGPANYNECYIHGRDRNGAAVDGPGTILLNGRQITVPNGPLFSNQGPATGFILFASEGAGFSTGLGERPYVFARRVDGAWKYDANDAGWTSITLEQRHVVIGEMETGSADTGNPGSPPGILSATMYAAASTPNVVAGLADIGYLAKSVAAAAQQTATDAVGSAGAALSMLQTMRSNGYLSADEKPAVMKAYYAAYYEIGGIQTQGNQFGLTALVSAYVAAYEALGTYLAGLTPAWNDTTSDTPIIPAVDQAKWQAYYSTRQALLNAIADEAGKRATALQISGLTTFRVIAAGGNASPPTNPGLHIQGSLSTGGYRSYVLTRIRRSDAAVVYSRQYDVYGDPVEASRLAQDLNSSGPDVIVVVRSHDEPQQNRLSHGLPEAMYRCGASRAVFGSPRFRYRSAYVLVGIPGCGEGNGAESYQGAADGDPLAWVDVSFQIVASCLVGVTANYQPTTLQDFSYTGDLDAQANSRIGLNSYGQIYGIGAGSGTTISNQQILIQDGVMTGIGTGGVQVDNSHQQWNQVQNRPADDAIRNNLVDVSWWCRDASIPWGTNGEYNRLVSTAPGGGTDLSVPGPKGSSDCVWFCSEQTGDGNAGGGWYGPQLSLDPTKTYRFVIPIRRHAGAGSAYWGTNNVCDLNTGNVNGNPYFCASSGMSSDRWYLFVGHVYPAGSSGNTNDSAGIWDCRTGTKIANGQNWTFRSGDGSVNHRAYQFYATSGAQQLFGRPMVNLVDGSEPSLREYFEPSAVLNDSITVAGGAILGIGAGSGTAVANNFIGINGAGQFYGGGAGNGITVSNNQMSMSADGRLWNAGNQQGQITTITVLDGDRYTDRAPNYYVVGTTREFKHADYVGLSSGNGAWVTLETIKQYPDSQGSQIPAFQYCYQADKTWRRRAANDEGTAWTAWVQDLDRNAYTGSLDATRNRTYLQDGDPAVSPGGVVDFEEWKTLTPPQRSYRRIAGTWLPIVADGSVDTSQLASSAATDVTEFAFAGWVWNNIA